MEEKDKIRARLEQMSKDLRQKAIEMEEAITISRNLRAKDIEAQKRLIAETEEKLKFYKYVLAQITAERWSENQRKSKTKEAAPDQERIFAEASTGEEAEGKTQSAEERVLKFTGKTKEEILKSGTLKEKITLFFCYDDAKNYFDNESELTREEESSIGMAFNTDEDYRLGRKCRKEYDALCRFGEQLRFYFKRFQTCYSALAKLLNKWDSYDNMAQLFNDQLKMIQSIPTADSTDKGGLVFRTEAHKEAVINRLMQQFFNSKLEGATIDYDTSKDRIFANVYANGGLYDMILIEANETAEAMSDFKGLAVAAHEFIEKSELHYTPISIEGAIENALTEQYTRYLVKNLRYFRSELRKKKSHTSEDRKRALIPDFLEVKPTREFLKQGREALKQYSK